MTEYIAFNDAWVPDRTDEELRQKSRAVKPLVAEMKAAGVLIFTGGLDDAAPVLPPAPAGQHPLLLLTRRHLDTHSAARDWGGHRGASFHSIDAGDGEPISLLPRTMLPLRQSLSSARTVTGMLQLIVLS